MDAIAPPPQPMNEAVLDYTAGSKERLELESELILQSSASRNLPARIGSDWVTPSGPETQVVQPHSHAEVLGYFSGAGNREAARAADAAIAAGRAWRELPFTERAAVFLRAAELLAGPWRQKINAATMLGQGKNAYQAEIDSACELIDFWRFNVHYAQQILEEQPLANSRGVWNRLDHRPLEGFVYAITPFNFTAIAGNLPTAPALMGNTVIWKPAPTQQLAASLIMELLIEAGLPDGVINMLPGNGAEISEVLLRHPDLAGIHFTGSTPTFHTLWRTVGENIGTYRSYPRLVGETGGKGFVVAHPSADTDALTTALIRGAFDYSGQKCSATSRAYIPRSVWERMGDDLIDQVNALAIGDPRDFTNFAGAVIDERSFVKQRNAIERARATDGVSVVAGGEVNDEIGWFVRPTVALSENAHDELFNTEYFGPILGVNVFDDHDFDRILKVADQSSPYALTGSIFARDRGVINRASELLRFTAGNFYVNDKSTGAVVGQQPFGGGRASGTNDKAGAPHNLLRWTSPRTIKETFVAPTAPLYPHQRA